MARETINLLQQIGVQVTGVQQVETATAAGAVTGSGNASITVTAVAMGAASPKVISVPVVNGDAAATWAEKVRQKLAIDPDVASKFIVGGTGTSIILTRSIPAADDGTLNIAIATGTATGITAAPTSANTTAGVAKTSGVAATKRFSGLMVNLSDSLETKQFRAWGSKFNTISSIHKRWAAGNYNGPLSYVEICYILASLVPYTVGSAGGVSTWDFLPNPTGSDPFQLYTLETGDDEAVEQYSDFMFTSFEGTWGLDDVQCSGDCISKAQQRIFALSGGVSILAQKPVLRPHVDLFIDSVYANIGTTKMEDTFEGRFRIGEKYEPKWVLNSSEASYRDMVEKFSELTMTTVFEANAQGRAVVDDLLANNTGRFLRLNSEGGEIGSTGTDYLMQLDFYGMVQDVRPQKDYNGVVYAYEVDWSAIQEDTMGRAWRMKVKNALTAL